MNEGTSKVVLGLVLGLVLGVFAGQLLPMGGAAEVRGANQRIEAVGLEPGGPRAESSPEELAAATLASAGVRAEAPTNPAPASVSEAEVRRLVEGVAASEESRAAGDGAISGRVTGPTGAGLAGALIRVVRVSERRPRSASSLGDGPPAQDDLEAVVRRAVERHSQERSNTYEVRSGADGAYRIEGLPEATWRVFAYLEGHALDAIGDSYGIPTGAVVDYRAEPVIAVPVRVVGRSGQLVQEADLVLEQSLGGASSEETVRWSAEEPTLRLRPGRYELHAVAGLRKDRSSESTRLALDAGVQASEVVLTLRDRLGVRARVYDGPGERIEGRLMARMMPLAAGEEVDLTLLADSNQTEWVQPSRTFEFLDLKAGSYAVGVSWGWGGPIAAHEVVQVVDEIVELDLQLPALDEQEFLRVRVLDDAGRDVPGVNFMFRHEQGGGSSSSSLQSLTTASGVHLLSIPARQREAYFAGTEGHSFQLQVSAGELGSATADLAPGQLDLTVSMTAPARLEVTVAGYVGSGYEGRLSISVGLAGERSFTSHGERISSEGVQVFEGLQPGDHRAILRLVPKGEGGFSWGTEIAAIDLPLTAGDNFATLTIPSLHSFRVLSADAKEGANISLRSSSNASDFATYHRSEFDAEGVALFEDVPAGDYILSGSFASGATMEVRVPTGDITYEPKPVNALRVTIEDETGDLHRIGLRTGDLVIGRDGREFEDIKDLQGLQVLMQSKSAEFELMVQRGSQVLTFPVKGTDIGDWKTFGGDLDPASR